MQTLLKVKHYHVFVFIFGALVLNTFTLIGHPLISALIKISGFWIYMGYLLILSNAMQKYVSQRLALNHGFFQFNAIIVIGSYSIIMILSDGEGMEFEGVIALPFFYVFYALLYSISFPARILRTIELKRKVQFGDYFAEFFAFLFLPIGIWFIQPRINKMLEEAKVEERVEEIRQSERI